MGTEKRCETTIPLKLIHCFKTLHNRRVYSVTVEYIRMPNYITNAFTKLHKLKARRKPTVISLFSGCGGLDWAFHKAGYNLVWANDSNENAVLSFQKNISDKIEGTSIEDVNFEALPSADIILGGFPCQDFSQIWKKPGLHGTRGNLYSYFAEIVSKKKPKLFIAENVKGLLSANNGRAIETIIQEFREAVEPGYLVIPKLVNFADYGVPQLRERVLLFGIRLDTDFDFCLPATSHSRGGNGGKKPWVSAGKALADIGKNAKNKERMNIAPRTIKILEKIPPGGNFTNIPKDDPLYVKGMISHVYRRLHPQEPSKTIIAGGGGGTWGYHHKEPRALTNRERARIQGFPDTFVFEGSFGEIRRQIGNAVPPVGMIPFVNEISKLFNKGCKKTDLEKINEELSSFTPKQFIRRVNTTSELSMSDIITQPSLL